MKVTCVEWPDGMTVADDSWRAIAASLRDQHCDVLLTNELPFGRWLAAEANFDRRRAKDSVTAHDAGLAALAELGIPLVLTSRPAWHGDRLVNEAVAVVDGSVISLHCKQRFPAEPGWWETSWFTADGTGYNITRLNGLSVGVLLCTELMFNEHARHYGVQDADLIVVPRATDPDPTIWRTAGAMAAIVSGAYVASSNRSGGRNPVFGGAGFAFGPDGTLLGGTDTDNPLFSFDLDRERTRQQRSQAYPCYVARAAELG